MDGMQNVKLNDDKTEFFFSNPSITLTRLIERMFRLFVHKRGLAQKYEILG